MELLLILSALLSTLTGVVTGTRAPDLHVQSCAIAGQGARAIAVSVAPRLAGHRHLLGAIGVRPDFAVTAAPVLRAAVSRLYLDRLRA